VVFYAILNLLAAAAATAALASAKSLRLAPTPATKRFRRLLMAAAGLVFIGALAAFAMVIQDKAGINLAMPATVKTDARLWLDAHAAETPNRSMPGTNLKVIRDAAAFYESHSRSMPADAASRLGPMTLIETRPKRILSLGEESKAYDAAKAAFEVMQEIAQEGAVGGKSPEQP
jgi:hypothetical protein